MNRRDQVVSIFGCINKAILDFDNFLIKVKLQYIDLMVNVTDEVEFIWLFFNDVRRGVWSG